MSETVSVIFTRNKRHRHGAAHDSVLVHLAVDTEYNSYRNGG